MALFYNLNITINLLLFPSVSKKYDYLYVSFNSLLLKLLKKVDEASTYWLTQLFFVIMYIHHV